jgi:hypothetical protein
MAARTLIAQIASVQVNSELSKQGGCGKSGHARELPLGYSAAIQEAKWAFPDVS